MNPFDDIARGLDQRQRNSGDYFASASYLHSRFQGIFTLDQCYRWCYENMITREQIKRAEPTEIYHAIKEGVSL